MQVATAPDSKSQILNDFFNSSVVYILVNALCHPDLKSLSLKNPKRKKKSEQG
jgi:hypothetical protein